MAAVAGTSVPTVSKVLRGGTDVSPETRLKSWTPCALSGTPAGQQTLTIDQDNGGWNIHQLTFS